MEVVSHRYLLGGKNREAENTLSQLRLAQKEVVFFETDIRRTSGGEFYISHDPNDVEVVPTEYKAELHAKTWKMGGSHLMLNLKELGYEEGLIGWLNQNDVLRNVTLFDFELLGVDPIEYTDKLKSINSGVRFAYRVSDRDEPIERVLGFEPKAIWLDEFDNFWAKKDDILKLKETGAVVLAVSPDLHGHTLEISKKRWKDFAEFGVDGVCTDYVLAFREFFGVKIE